MAIPPVVDHVVVRKADHSLTLYAHGKPLRSYRVALGQVTGAKSFAGDRKTPEGHYTIDGHNPHSRFHLALHVSYPNEADRAHARLAHRAPGGDIMIHALPVGFGVLGPVQHFADWTAGCITLSNSEMDEVYRLVANGTPIDIER